MSCYIIFVLISSNRVSVINRVESFTEIDNLSFNRTAIYDMILGCLKDFVHRADDHLFCCSMHLQKCTRFLRACSLVSEQFMSLAQC